MWCKITKPKPTIGKRQWRHICRKGRVSQSTNNSRSSHGWKKTWKGWRSLERLIEVRSIHWHASCSSIAIQSSTEKQTVHRIVKAPSQPQFFQSFSNTEKEKERRRENIGNVLLVCSLFSVSLSRILYREWNRVKETGEQSTFHTRRPIETIWE